MPISRWISVSDSADMMAPLFTLARQAATYQAGIPSHSSRNAREATGDSFLLPPPPPRHFMRCGRRASAGSPPTRPPRWVRPTARKVGPSSWLLPAARVYVGQRRRKNASLRWSAFIPPATLRLLPPLSCGNGFISQSTAAKGQVFIIRARPRDAGGFYYPGDISLPPTQVEWTLHAEAQFLPGFFS